MQPPTSIVEVRQQIARIKAGGTEFITTFFLDDAAIEQAIRAGTLLFAFNDDAVVMVRRGALFDRVYFADGNRASLSRTLASVPLAPDGCLISDLIGTAAETAPVIDQFVSAGFSRFTEFRSMYRANSCNVDVERRAMAEAALEEDAEQIWSYISGYFDPYSEHIPDQQEVLTAVKARTVLVTRNGGSVSAILWYDRKGASSILRYWLVLPQFRGRGLGKQLMARYFNDCADVRSFRLWVQSSNCRAMRLYQHYGYVLASRTDYILKRT